MERLPGGAGSRPLPRGWRWAQLGEIADYLNGRAFKPDEWRTAGLPIIRIQNLNSQTAPFNFFGGRVDVDHEVQDGDLLISWSASLEAFIWNRGPAVLNQHIFKVVENRKVVTRQYLYLAVRNAMAEIRERVHGATMRHITKPEFEAIQVPLAPLDQQLHITAIVMEQMAVVERARVAAETQLEAAGAMPSAYLRKLFDSAEAQSWERKRVRDIAECSSGATPARDRAEYFGGTIPWVKTGELKDDLIERTEEYVTEAALRETSLRLLPAGTLLVAMYGQGQTRGRTGLLAEPATTNQACFAILPNPAEFDPAYLQLWFRYSYLRIRGHSEGRGGNQPNLNGVLLGSEEVPLPPVEQQRRVVDVAETGIGAGEIVRKAVSQEIEALGALPGALLRRAFSGEL